MKDHVPPSTTVDSHPTVPRQYPGGQFDGMQMDQRSLGTTTLLPSPLYH